MIATELTVVCLLFLWGAAAGILSSALNVFGRASEAARCVADVLIAFSIAAAYFFGLFFAASGEFRAYSLAAFIAGVSVSARLCARFYPVLRRIGKRVISPIISLERKMEKRVESAVSPILEKRRIKIEERKAKKEEKRRKRRERKEEKRREKARIAAERGGENVGKKGKARRKGNLPAPPNGAKGRVADRLLRRQRN